MSSKSQERMTVGGELRRMRTRRGISQFDLAVCMDWKGTNPIIQIEKDRRVPRPDTITRLGKCLGLSFLEVHYLMGLAGYHQPTRLPPPEYVIDTLNEIAHVIEDFPYPMYVLDFQLRFWLTNPATALFTLGDTERLRELLARPLHAFDIIFDSRLGMRSRIAALKQVEREQIFRYKASNAFRQHEDFFLTLPDRMRHLAPEDYRVFLNAWQLIDVNQNPSIHPVEVQAFYSRMKQGDITLQFPTGDVAFHLRVESVLHLGDLLQIITFVPVDEAHAQKICPAYLSESGETLKVWELMDIRTYYAETPE